ncbi:hypothetical protein ED733_000408, partial [Metarhizium rileyi]
ALLLAFSAATYAASVDTTGQNQIALWVPNPCDKLWDLSNDLRQSFIKLQKDKVSDLNVITAYVTYTVSSISPSSTDTWSFNTQGPTPILTSAYNSAECSSYYPPPATGTLQPTGPSTTVNHAAIPTTNTLSSTTNTAATSTATVPSSTTNAAVTSTPIDTAQTRSTTSSRPGSTSTNTNTASATSVTSHNADNPTTSVPSPVSNTVTSPPVKTAISYTRISCFEVRRFLVNETLVTEFAADFCQQVSDGKIKPQNEH